MDIKQLQIFAAVADGMSFTNAAQVFGLTRSAVSHIIASLENDLGADLLIRNNHELILSESGTVFLSHARKIIRQYEEATEVIAAIANYIPGELRLGITSFIEPYIREACAKLLKENPTLKTEVFVYRAHTLNQLLKAGKIDIAFTLNKAYDNEDFISLPCIPIKIMAVMSKTHALAVKDKVTYDDLCHYDCIMPAEDHRAFATINKYFDGDLSKIKSRCSINTADGALNMVSEESFICFATPQHIINRPNLVAKPIEGLEMEITSNMHYRKNAHLKKSANLLFDVLKNYTIPYFKALEL